MSAYWTYILQLRTGHYYVGHTGDLDRRIGEHMSGEGDGFVANRLPCTLVYADQFETRTQAFEQERRLKSWSRAKKEAFMEQRWSDLSILATPPKERQQRILADTKTPSQSSRAQSRDALKLLQNNDASLDCARDDEVQDITSNTHADTHPNA
ncbi:GIY-YIG nuclease family protein [Pacificimonas sp. WHA3]|uniref:GIY-YIG nuclease family protein n=1 Tax=Pacificimonas pallii TaxID=2827236 RepID=A0ABS6SDU1_9SPHN|nr:GIY-YIG nuclease family protein [Pacificimonas pallii]MBV7256584.1 GIY-YIG nuclease family protein [Pacificimonas pallii]